MEDHAHITEAVEAHDADRAARLMSDHLNKIRRDIENQAKELNGKM
ncbi:MAG: hypothetical protein LIP23_10295 [Planctomycetes bacterium]|nr:hypothetical protein [Planctomycetota bacterium]